MIFLTVGTQFPFDRLVKSVDEIAAGGGFDQPVFAQIGNTSHKPRHMRWTCSLDKDLFDRQVHDASCVISHAGMGTIMTALEHNKPLLVMPRLKSQGEVVNDHQLAIARRLEQSGLVLVAYSEQELPEKVRAIRHFSPMKRQNAAGAVAGRIGEFLVELVRKKSCHGGLI